METNEILIQIKGDIDEIKKNIATKVATNPISDKWIPRSEVMKFFNYADTQMASLEKDETIVVTKVGKRKFIHRDSISKLLDKNIITP